MAGGFGAPLFVVFFAAVIVAVCALILWLELVVRAAAVSAATLFLPLCLAALVWPAISHWCRRLAETIAALVISKFVIAAVISLAAGALAGGLRAAGPNGGGFAAVGTGVALLVIATICPFTVLKMVPAIEAGAIGHLESVRHRITGAPRQAAISLARDAADLAGWMGGGGSSVMARGAGTAGVTPGTGAFAPGGAAAGYSSPAGDDSFPANDGQDQEGDSGAWTKCQEVTAAATARGPESQP